VANPIIGLTASRTTGIQNVKLHSVAEAYVQALIDAGGTPVLIPLGLPGGRLAPLLERLDGVLFTGGGDIHPERYAGQPHPLVDLVDDDRDRVELSLLQEMLPQQKPFLGICRGLQLINVGLGGSLYEDILDQHPSAQRHQYYLDYPRSYQAHPVQIEPGSRLAAILGQTQAQVNSLHHQGIRRLGSELIPSAYAPDGIIEAVELAGHPFGMAVQWHPEWLTHLAEMRQLFAAFVQACAEHSR
jgi:putative glutamine amidotransferase